MEPARSIRNRATSSPGQCFSLRHDQEALHLANNKTFIEAFMYRRLRTGQTPPTSAEARGERLFVRKDLEVGTRLLQLSTL